MRVTRGDLVSAANGKADSSPEAKASHDQAWYHKKSASGRHSFHPERKLS
jgi:hypothetical protein